MAGNTFGTALKITTYGESHGIGLGVVIDGFPANIQINHDLIKRDLARRKPGQSKIVTQRKENEEYEILSGIFEGRSTGTPISVLIRNQDQRSKDYSHIKDTYRPSHADFTYAKKYGNRDYRGGGRSSARETVARVIAGAFCKMLLQRQGISIVAYVSQVGAVQLAHDKRQWTSDDVEQNIVRCPNESVAKDMIKLIETTKKNGDTIGGIISCSVHDAPVGLGEPVFDKLHADLGKAMLSINAVKGFEYGSGFGSVNMYGSQHNDEFENSEDGIITSSNHSGGIQGGISNGMDIYFRVAFKPVATIMRDQSSIDKSGQKATIKGKGRHDPCVVPRAVPIVEAMAAIVIADHLMRSRLSKV